MAKTIPLKKKTPVAASKQDATLYFEIKEGILYGKYPEGILIDLNYAKLAVKERLAYSHNQAYPCLFDMRGIKGVSRDARHYFGTEGARLVSAGALIVSSPLTRTLANIFLALQKPRTPTRLFDNEDEARKWLRQFI